MRPIVVLFAVACTTAAERTPSTTTSATAYCELTASAFCEYYARCDRMAVDTLAECQNTFLETCEGVFEPRYAALEARGDLALSTAGVGECAEHLRTVECSQQVFDLDGACGAVWDGQVGEGGACGPGLESFVCDDEHTCVLTLSFCGTCEPFVPAGSACGDGVRCDDNSSCIDDVCVLDAAVGDACNDEQPCRLGARCTEGVCTTNAIVGLGEACDSGRRCQYRAECVDGVCEQAPLLGEACTSALACASGWCDGGTCESLGEPGAACASPQECLGGVCDAGACGELTSACLVE
ncbi:MAG: hypothetical protein ACJATT_005439 [Myxococcota bacterium]